MAKRRPGRDPEANQQSNSPKASITPDSQSKNQPEVSVVDVESGVHEAAAAASDEIDQASVKAESFEHQDSQAHHQPETEASPKVEINFKGSEILRAKFPAPFEVAEKVATDWVHGGRFEGLPLGHPLAQYFAAKGLRKAKELEKKVLESPVTEKIAMQALTAGLKAQEIISQVREKVKK